MVFFSRINKYDRIRDVLIDGPDELSNPITYVEKNTQFDRSLINGILRNMRASELLVPLYRHKRFAPGASFDEKTSEIYAYLVDKGALSLARYNKFLSWRERIVIASVSYAAGFLSKWALS